MHTTAKSNAVRFFVYFVIATCRAYFARSNTVMAPALILTTSDTISLVYPKEMGYEKDYLHIIFKLTSSLVSSNANSLNTIENPYRIEDAVYDTKTFSIYFILSNGSSSGSELIRLRRHNKNAKETHNFHHATVSLENSYSYELATNWSFAQVYANHTSKLLSLDLNVDKRKLYWFEFNVLEKKWILAIFKLETSRLVFKKFNDFSFNNDGYSFITVARDTFVRRPLGKNKSREYVNDIVLFVSNNQTLNICFIANMTCSDYFQATSPEENVQRTTTFKTNAAHHVKDYEYSDEETGVYIGGQSYDADFDAKNETFDRTRSAQALVMQQN